jgi:mRNA interferase MazF
MARILRGEIRWANLNPTVGAEQAGLRPVLVLSKNVFNDKSGTVIAVALTSQPQKAGFPLTLELIKTKNLPKSSWVKISQIRTLSVQRLGDRITIANEEEISQVAEGLNEIIGA